MEDDEFENSLSLAAIEAELKPKGSRDLRHGRERIQKAAPPAGAGHRIPPEEHITVAAQERKYKKLKEEIIGAVKSLRLNQARIDSLVSSFTTSTSAWSASKAG
jgi:RNA polymerase primary sigma factor